MRALLRQWPQPVHMARQEAPGWSAKFDGCYPVPMRRWLAILMLTFLPFQFSWAAVAVYCGHESKAQSRTEAQTSTQHVGHHDHQHLGNVGTSQPSDPAGQNTAANFDFDCGHCHGSCCSMPALVGITTPIAATSRPPVLTPGAVRTLAQSPPERPQWLHLA
jgi:hypothetical protein